MVIGFTMVESEVGAGCLEGTTSATEEATGTGEELPAETLLNLGWLASSLRVQPVFAVISAGH